MCVEQYKERVATAKTNLVKAEDDFTKWLEIFIPSLLSLKEDLLKTPKVHANNISFTVIETDILNKKTILPRFKNYICFNPKLTKRFRTDWESKLGENTVPNDKFCKKFAKF